MDLQHKELTEKIIGAAFEVYNALGYRFLEKTHIKVGLLINFGRTMVEFKRFVY